MNAPYIRLELKTQAATELLGEDLALALKSGDLVLLSGDLGSGKSTLARALIRASNDDQTMEVPSPTFTLAQMYEASKPLVAISHFDLYRLEDAEDVEELGISEALETGIALVEWPQRAVDHLPQDGLTILLAHESENCRTAVLSGDSAIIERVERSLAIRKFLDTNWHAGVTRRYMLGDASTRAYETVLHGGERRILMNSPPMADGPIIRDGKPYSQIAHLAENVRPFVAIAQLLRQHGFVVPDIFAEDLKAGFLLISDLGDEAVVDENNKPVAEKYITAAETLAEMHQINWPQKVSIDGGHTIPPYDRVAMMIETDLLAQWYVPRVSGNPLEDTAQTRYEEIWQALINRLEASEKTLVLRDFHSPNLIWQADNSGINRVGLIDFQDAVFGPCAYDLASLAQDARVSVSGELEQALVDTYVAARRENLSQFDAEEFLEAYAIMAAQRACKLLGLFVRLDQRDHKTEYLAHIPRLKTYLARDLKHPVLAELKRWCRENIDI